MGPWARLGRGRGASAMGRCERDGPVRAQGRTWGTSASDGPDRETHDVGGNPSHARMFSLNRSKLEAWTPR